MVTDEDKLSADPCEDMAQDEVLWLRQPGVAGEVAGIGPVDPVVYWRSVLKQNAGCVVRIVMFVSISFLIDTCAGQTTLYSAA